MYTPSLQSLFHTQRVALAHFVLNAAHDHWSWSTLLAHRGSRPIVHDVEVVALVGRQALGNASEPIKFLCD